MNRNGTYRLILADRGDCSIHTAADCLMIILGYHYSEAMELVSSVPVLAADGLSCRQALSLAEAMDEFGTGVEVTDREGHRIPVPSSHRTVLKPDGSFTDDVEEAMQAMTAARRISTPVRFRKPRIRELFTGIQIFTAL